MPFFEMRNSMSPKLRIIGIGTQYTKWGVSPYVRSDGHWNYFWSHALTFRLKYLVC